MKQNVVFLVAKQQMAGRHIVVLLTLGALLELCFGLSLATLMSASGTLGSNDF